MLSTTIGYDIFFAEIETAIEIEVAPLGFNESVVTPVEVETPRSLRIKKKVK